MPSNEKSGHPTTLRYNEKPVYTTSNGAPIGNPQGWQRTGPMGPLLLQDFHLIDALSHFDRKSISCPPACCVVRGSAQLKSLRLHPIASR